MNKEYMKHYTYKSNESFNSQALRDLILFCKSEKQASYNPQLDEILNSRRWKLVSRIQLPEALKKISRKLIK